MKELEVRKEARLNESTNCIVLKRELPFCLRPQRAQLCSILIIEICITNYKKYLVADIELFFQVARIFDKEFLLLLVKFKPKTTMTLAQGGNLNEFFFSVSLFLCSQKRAPY